MGNPDFLFVQDEEFRFVVVSSDVRGGRPILPMQFANQFFSFSKFSVLLRGECESALRSMKVLVVCFGVAMCCERIGGDYYSGQNCTHHTMV